MPLLAETYQTKQPVNKVLRETVITAFAFLFALEFRDFIIDVIMIKLPNKTNEQLPFSAFILLLIALVTLIMITYWKDC